MSSFSSNLLSKKNRSFNLKTTRAKIQFYEGLLEMGVIAENGAAHSRLKDLKTRQGKISDFWKKKGREK